MAKRLQNLYDVVVRTAGYSTVLKKLKHQAQMREDRICIECGATFSAVIHRWPKMKRCKECQKEFMRRRVHEREEIRREMKRKYFGVEK